MIGKTVYKYVTVTKYSFGIRSRALSVTKRAIEVYANLRGQRKRGNRGIKGQTKGEEKQILYEKKLEKKCETRSVTNDAVRVIDTQTDGQTE